MKTDLEYYYEPTTQDKKGWKPKALDFFEILQLPRDFKKEKAEQQVPELLSAFSSTTNPNAAKFKKITRDINKAWRTLSNDRTREEYLKTITEDSFSDDESDGWELEDYSSDDSFGDEEAASPHNAKLEGYELFLDDFDDDLTQPLIGGGEDNLTQPLVNDNGPLKAIPELTETEEEEDDDDEHHQTKKTSPTTLPTDIHPPKRVEYLSSLPPKKAEHTRPQKYQATLEPLSEEHFDFDDGYDEFTTKLKEDETKPSTSTTLKEDNDTFRLLVKNASTGEDFYRLVLLQQKGIGFGKPWGGFLQKAANAGVKEARELWALYELKGFYGINVEQSARAWQILKDIPQETVMELIQKKSHSHIPILNLPVPKNDIEIEKAKSIQSAPFSKNHLALIEKLTAYMDKVESTGGWSKKHQFAHGNFGLFKSWQAQNRHATYLLAMNFREQLMSGMPINSVFKDGNTKEIKQYRRKIMKENGYALQDHGINSKEFNDILREAGAVVQNAEHRHKN